jgi:nucleoside phosphorylase
MIRTFPSIHIGFLVGIGGGVAVKPYPIRLGDIVVSKPSSVHGGVVQYDFGKLKKGGMEPCDSLNAPPPFLGTVVTALQAMHELRRDAFANYVSQLPQFQRPEFQAPSIESDILFESDYSHKDGGSCNECNKSKTIPRDARNPPGPNVHYGNIGLGNVVMQDPATRNRLSRKFKLLYFEMEAVEIYDFPCLVV